MSALRFPDDLLSAEERQALAEISSRLLERSDEFGIEWVEALLPVVPEAFRTSGAWSVSELQSIGSRFAVQCLERLRGGDYQALSQDCYQIARAMLEGGGTQNVSLDDLHRMSRLGAQTIERRLDPTQASVSVSLGKLTSYLLTVICDAYSDVRAGVVERERRELERVVEERKAALEADIAQRRRAEEQVQREKRFADAIIEALPGVFYLFDETGRFIRWNRNFETVTGYDSEEVARMHPTDFFDGEGRKEVAKRMQEVFEIGSSTAEAEFVSKDGRRTPYFFTGMRIVFNGQTCLIGSGIDATERKRAEQEVRRSRAAQLFAALLESAPDAMVVSDAGGGIVFANSQAEHLFGYPRSELVRQSLTQLFADSLDGQLDAEGGAQLTTSVESDALRSDGARVPVEVKLSPVQTEDGPLLTSAIRDITDRKRAEEEIHRLNLDLERRVAERTEELARSNADLEQFAYVTSHDLQEPLRAVASYTQLLERRYRERLDGDALRFIDRTVAAVNRMQSLIRELLGYSRLGTGGEPAADTDCEEVLREVLEDLQTAIAEAEAIVSHDALPSIVVVRAQLRQLLQNLIGNAIKFRSAERPRVHVAAHRNGTHWLFSVQDNGIGIQSEYRERVFVIFQRLHGRSSYPGTGVGLAICKKIVERHGGHIWIEPGAHGGTTVYFRLPVESAIATTARGESS